MSANIVMFLRCAEEYLYAIGEMQFMNDVRNYANNHEDEINELNNIDDICEFAISIVEEIISDAESEIVTQYNFEDDESTDTEDDEIEIVDEEFSFGWNKFSYFMKCVDDYLKRLSKVGGKKFVDNLRSIVYDTYINQPIGKRQISECKTKKQVCVLANTTMHSFYYNLLHS